MEPLHIDAALGPLIETSLGVQRYFGGTDYLGLSRNKRFRSLMLQGIKRFGVHMGSSRQSNVRLSIYQKAEKILADLAGSQAASLTSSGMLSGQWVSQFFNTEQYVHFYAPFVHSALITRADQPRYPDWTSLINDLNHSLTQFPQQIPVLFLDTIDFHGIGYPHYAPLRGLPLSQIILVADDAHGIGITGQQGGGSYALLAALKPKELIVTASLGKSLGLGAGAVWASQAQMDALRQHPLWGGASPCSPGYAYVLIKAQRLYRAQQKKLARHVAWMKKHWPEGCLKRQHADHPAFECDTPGVGAHLCAHHIIPTEFPYPTPQSPLLTRVVITAAHSKKDLKALRKALILWVKKQE
ncbi:MAG: aminotransferase class I/II-fold pyridoxal phosphate-dependent enzyme [Flavobacteriaceae bacterium]|nr:aminotransferase class I/II-fold pyridoxal phosphate-dependent enzyme [Flavobacteriaceae bacterium]MDP4674691.1 aminotransferase class I/II-fold pyridoxal phosphate-dependent enzyme [Flavobacteriaceae bacterium]